MTPQTAGAAKQFAAGFLTAAGGLAALCFAAVTLIDPYGVSALRLPMARALMDQNQRFMYPQIVKSRRYDSAVFGSSTIRLIDPAGLSQTLGGSFAMLGVNAASVREQIRIADAFRRGTAAAGALVWGIDTLWCDTSASLPAPVAARVFPEWLWGQPALKTFTGNFSMRALEISGRMVLYSAGRLPERIRADGYEVFTPPESNYDLGRARFHLWKGGDAASLKPLSPPVRLSETELAALAFPAVALLDHALAAFPEAVKILVFPPVHFSGQPQPGSREAALLEACKTRVAAMAKRHAALVIDFMIGSSVTSEDANYWDPLHYRLPVAAKLPAAIAAAARQREDDPQGFYQIR